MTERDPACLWDIVDAAECIVGYMHGQTLEMYLEDRKLRDAVERNLEIVGEASRRLSKTFRQGHPEIPWRKMIGLRNILSHEYDAVDAREIWEIAAVHIPLLVRDIKPLIPPLPPA
ncbi:MAG: DUF86 domain-containing protein [Verrucomicrobiae bacterium]|nr:DUF86 domain-containing protein [Verrucomicrobiae bacterium]